ncbi:MAG: LysR family transcriptional regulator [Coriobacteriales bacterium]|nr:LysR family transcriptional regulator [Coriobacteriales bacterium]
MQIRVLEEYTHLCRSRSFSKTAVSMGISQPLLSKHISGMEKELGVTLINRGSHSFELTSEGLQVFESAIRIVDCWNEMEGKLVKDRYRKSVIVGGLIANRYFTHTLEELVRRENGQLILDYAQGLHFSEDSFNFLINGSIDILINHRRTIPAPYKELIRSQYFTGDPFVAIVSSVSPYARRRELTLRELEDATFIHVFEENLISEEGWIEVRNQCIEHGFIPKSQPFYIKSTGAQTRKMLPSMSAQDVFIVSKSSGPAELSGDYCAVPIIDAHFEIMLYCLRKPANRFIEEVIHAAAHKTHEQPLMG